MLVMSLLTEGRKFGGSEEDKWKLTGSMLSGCYLFSVDEEILEWFNGALSRDIYTVRGWQEIAGNLHLIYVHTVCEGSPELIQGSVPVGQKSAKSLAPARKEESLQGAPKPGGHVGTLIQASFKLQLS